MTRADTDGDFERSRLFFLLEQVGETCGIKIDFTHPDIDPDHWWAPNGLASIGLKFPWSDDFTRAGRFYSEAIVEVSAGDALCVGSVCNLQRGLDSFADPHDAFKKSVYVKLKKSGGEIVDIEEPLLMVALDAMGPHSKFRPEGDSIYDLHLEYDYGITLDKIGGRIARLLEAGWQGEALTWLELANDLSIQVDEWMAEHEGHRSDELFSLDRNDFEDVLDRVAAASYALAQAEAVARVVPLAIAGKKARDSLALATKGARGRSDPVREQAILDIKENPRTSQNSCARRVAAKMGRDPRSVARAIGGLFDWVPLANGGREKRPRPDIAGIGKSPDRPA